MPTAPSALPRRAAWLRLLAPHHRVRIAAGLLVLLVVTSGASGFWARWLGLTAAAEAGIAVLLVAAILWISEAVPLFVTSFVVLALELVWLVPALRAAGTPVAPDVFLAPFFSDIILLFLGGFTLSVALHRYGLDERLARWILARTGDRPASVLLGLMGATAFLSMWMSNTATTAVMLALALPLLARIPPGDRFRQALLLAIPFAANLGGLGTPIGTPPNAIALRAFATVGAAPGFLRWMALVVPLLLLVLVALWLLLLRLFPTRLTAIGLPAAVPTARHPGTRRVLVVFVLTGLGWLTSDLHGLSNGTVGLFPVVALFGLRLLGKDDVRALSWDVLLVVGGGLSLGVAVERSGLVDWLLQHVPLTALGPTALLLLFTGLAGLMTTFMSNTATANLLMPLVMGLAGVAPGPLLLAVACACSMAMALPVSTPPNAMAFSSGLLTARDMVRPGVLISGLGVLLVGTLGALWWRLLGVTP